MNSSGANDPTNSRSLTESQFRWRTALPAETGRPQEHSRGRLKSVSRRDSQPKHEESPLALGLQFPSSVLAAYDERVRSLRGPVISDRSTSERKSSDSSTKSTEAPSNFILYDQSGRIVPPVTHRGSSSKISERPHGHVNERGHRRRDSDHSMSREHQVSAPPKSAPVVGPSEPSLTRPTAHSQPRMHTHAPLTPISQTAAASLDLQPAPTSNGPSVHPVVIQNSAAALAPIRTLYEQAWYQTVSNVQTEMSRMHHELVDALERERSARSNLADEKKSLQQDLEHSREELRNVHREMDKLKGHYDRLRTENEGLRKTVEDGMQKGDRDDQVREAARSYIDGQLDQMKAQYSEQMEMQRAEAQRALEEQKAIFERERKELHIIATANEVMRSSSESASTLVASDTERVITPSYDRSTNKNYMRPASMHFDRPHAQRMSVSSGTRSPASSVSPQQLSGLNARPPAASYYPLSPLALTPSIPPAEVFSPAPDYVRRIRPGEAAHQDDAMEVDVKEAIDRSPAVMSQTLDTKQPIASGPSRSIHRPPSSPPSRPRLRSGSSPIQSAPTLLLRTYATSPNPVEHEPPTEQRFTPAASRPSPQPIAATKARSRHSSLSNASQRGTPPMSSLSHPATSRADSRPPSRPPSRPASRPVSPGGTSRPALKVAIPALIPHIATLERPHPPLRQQQNPPSSPISQEPEPPHSSLPSPAHPKTAHPPSSKPTAQQKQEASSAPQPRPKAQLPPPAQPTKPPKSQPPAPPPQQLQNQHQPTSFHLPLHQYQHQNYHASFAQSQPWSAYPHPYQFNPLAVLPPHSAQPSQSFSASEPQQQQQQRKRDRAEFEEDSKPGERATVRLKMEEGGEGMEANEHKEVKKINKIGINHMDLLYETRGQKMICRMCRMPGKDEQKTPTATFSADAKWAELIGHCQEVHPKACADLEKLKPNQVGELRQRMLSGKLTGYTVK